MKSPSASGYQYQCVVSAAGGSSTTSSVAAITVNSFSIGGSSASLINQTFPTNTTPAGWTFGANGNWLIQNTTMMTNWTSNGVPVTGSGGYYPVNKTANSTDYLTTPTVNASGVAGLQLSFACDHDPNTTAGSIVV